MIERIYVLEDADIEQFVGENKCNLSTLGNLFPRAKIRQHGNVIKVLASGEEADTLLKTLERLEEICVHFNHLTEDHIISAVKRSEQSSTTASEPSDLIIHGLHGKAIYARGRNQKKMVEEFTIRDLCMATGPAGSGKTFIAICLAVKALKTRQVRRIILSRPAVEAGEKLGFLPGEMKDKLDPYLQPLYDALGELIPAPKLKDYLDLGIIQIAPLAFMRGRTLSDAVIILDEAQNTTPQQMKMFLTRLGANSKMIITGDLTQIDLPRGQRSGLRDAVDKLCGVEGISFIHMEQADIVRHPLVARIVDVYDECDKQELATSHQININQQDSTNK